MKKSNENKKMKSLIIKIILLVIVSFSFGLGLSKFNTDVVSSVSYNDDYYYSSERLENNGLIAFLIVFIVGYAVISVSIYSDLKVTKNDSSDNKEETEHKDNYFEKNDDEEIKKLKRQAFHCFIYVMDAQSEGEFNELKRLCATDLSNSLKSKFKILNGKNQKNITAGYKILSSNIVEFSDKDGIITIEVLMKIRMLDYVIDLSNDKLVKGSRTEPVTNRYLMKFTKSKVNHKFDKCPYCKAKLAIASASKCDYCESAIIRPPKHFVMISKQLIK